MIPRRLGTATDGVAAGSIPGGAVLVTLVSGEMTVVANRKVILHLPGAFDPTAAANAVRLNEGEDWSIALAARLNLMTQLRDFRSKINRAQYWLFQTHWPAIQEHLRSPTRAAWSVVTIDDICQIVSERDPGPPHSPSAIRVAILLTVMSEHEYFALHTNDTFYVVPPTHVALCREVNQWIERNDSRYLRFVSKIKKLVELQEQRRPPLPAATSMERVPLKDITFNDSDSKILNFIGHSVNRTRFDQENPYALGLNSLARLLDRTHDGTTHFAVDLLKATGIIPSWGDPFLEDRAALRWAPKDQHIIDAEAKRIIDGYVDAPTQQLPSYHDGMDGRRHDWRDTEAYIIDDQNAHELDDGISLEEASDGSGCHWVHIHVADPTAIVRPDSEISRVAKERTTTLYLNDRTLPLLPPDVASVCSLGNRGPQPVMTFSGKIDAEGNVVDWAVRAAILRQSRVLTYDSVDEALGLEMPGKTLLNVWGEDAPSEPVVRPNIPAQTLSKLRMLSTIAGRLLERRVRNDAHLMQWLPRSQTKIHTPLLPAYKFPPMHPYHYPCIPITTLYGVDEQSSKSGEIAGARHMVAEYMVLAGVLAARFAKERKTPLIYRAVNVFGLDRLSGARNSKTGQVPWSPTVMSVDAEAKYTTEPDKNPFLGLGSDAYARTTSPLRRYCDLANHWLIKSALNPSGPKLPGDQLKRLAEELTVVEKSNTRRMKSDERYWRTFALNQALKKAPYALQGLKGLLIEDFPRLDQDGGHRDWHIGVHISSLGVDGRLIGLTREEGDKMQAGDLVDVDLVNVSVGLEGVCTFVRSNRDIGSSDEPLS